MRRAGVMSPPGRPWMSSPQTVSSWAASWGRGDCTARPSAGVTRRRSTPSSSTARGGQRARETVSSRFRRSRRATWGERSDPCRNASCSDVSGIDRKILEAPPGFEPGMEVLQTGSGAFRQSLRHNDLTRSFGKQQPFALREIREVRTNVWRRGQNRDSESHAGSMGFARAETRRPKLHVHHPLSRQRGLKLMTTFNRSTRRVGLVVALPVLFMTAAALQAAQSKKTFEVASVRRAEIPANAFGVPVFPVTGGVGTGQPLRITYRGTWLPPLIAEAFGVRTDQVTGPTWLTTERYDIVANIPPGATKDDFKLMLADLLRERFRLRFHMDSRIRPIYVLRAGNTGPRLKPTERRADDATAPSVGRVDAEGCPIVSPNYKGMVSRPVPGMMCWTARDVASADLARHLEQRAGRPVIDETGLTGRYDFKIRYEFLGRGGDPGAAADRAPSVFTAVEEQLGLKLEPSTQSFPALIIDSIEREPIEN